VINGGICYRASSVKHVMRCKVSSAASDDTAPAMSCIWDTVPSPDRQDTERPRTYIRSREVL